MNSLLDIAQTVDDILDEDMGEKRCDDDCDDVVKIPYRHSERHWIPCNLYPPFDYIFGSFPQSVMVTLAIYQGHSLLYKNYSKPVISTVDDDTFQPICPLIAPHNRVLGISFNIDMENITLVYQNSKGPHVHVYANGGVISSDDVRGFGHQFVFLLKKIVAGTQIYLSCREDYHFQDLVTIGDKGIVESRDIRLPFVIRNYFDAYCTHMYSFYNEVVRKSTTTYQ